MLVVIDIPDYGDADGLLRELRVLQEEAARIASDPGYDPDEDGALVALRTAGGHAEVGVNRIVGMLHPSAGLGDRVAIRPLES